MNLSDLIAATPETPKTKGAATGIAEDQSAPPEGGEFFGLTQDLSGEAPSASPVSDVPPEGAEPQSLAADPTMGFILTEIGGEVSATLGDDTIIADTPDTGLGDNAETEVSGDTTLVIAQAKSDTATFGQAVPTSQVEAQKPAPLPVPSPALSVTQNNAPSADPAPEAPVDTSLRATIRPAQQSADTPQTASAEQPRTPQPSLQSNASIVRSQPDARPSQPEISLPATGSTPTLPTPAQPTLGVTVPSNAPIAGLAQTRASVKAEEPAPSLRAEASRTVVESETLTVRSVEPVRTVPDTQQAPQQLATGSAEPRLMQFLSAHGALQTIGGESATFAATPTGTSSATAVTTTNAVAGALASEMPAQTVQRQVLPQIVGSIQAQMATGVIDLTLDPPELGRIEILIELTDRNLRATLSADRDGTGELIRRHADDLMQQFSDAGFGDVDLNFEERRNGTAEDEAPLGEHHTARNDTTDQADGTMRLANASADGRVDLRL